MTTVVTGDGAGVVSGPGLPVPYGPAGYFLTSTGVSTPPIWASVGAAVDIVIDTTDITGGTTTRLLYDKAGKVGETVGVGYEVNAVGTLTFSGQAYPGATLISSTAAANQKVWNIFNGPDNGGALFIQSVHDNFTTIDSEFRFGRDGTLRTFGANAGLLLGPTEGGADDASVTRVGVGTVGIGNGTAGDISGSFQAGRDYVIFSTTSNDNSGSFEIYDTAAAAKARSGGIRTTFMDGQRLVIQGAIGINQGIIGFAPTGVDVAAAADTAISRVSAGVMGVGNGTGGNTSGTLKAVLQTNANATTGLVAGVLAATTNASLVLTDGSGQVYRVPCII